MSRTTNGRHAKRLLTVWVALALAVPPVAAQTIVVGPPASSSAAPGAQLEVPIEVDMTGAQVLTLASLQLTLIWDPAWLTYVSATPSAPAGWSVTFDEAQVGTGILGVNLSNAAGTSESFTTSHITFEAADIQGQWAALDPDITAAADTGDDDLLAFVVARSGAVCIAVTALLGDVIIDGNINIIDAQQAARYSIGLETPNAPYIEYVGDVNEDGSISIIDAQQIARHALGLETPNSPGLGEPVAGCPNQAPTATITSPVDGSSYGRGATIAFSGTGTDPEDGSLAGDALVWTSSLDGQLGTGESFGRSDLTVGGHLIVLTVTDGDGATDADTVAIEVTESTAGLSGLWLGSSGDAVPDLGWVFTVNPEGTGITEITHFLGGTNGNIGNVSFQCGSQRTFRGWVLRTMDYPGWLISNGQFEADFLSLGGGVGYSYTLDMSIEGAFQSSQSVAGSWDGTLSDLSVWPILITYCSGSWAGEPATRSYAHYDGSTLFLSGQPSAEGESWVATFGDGAEFEWSGVPDQPLAASTYTFQLWLRATSGSDGSFAVTIETDHNGVVTTLASTTVSVTDAFKFYGVMAWDDEYGGSAGDPLTLRISYHGSAPGEMAFGYGQESSTVVPGRFSLSMPAASTLASAAAARIRHDDGPSRVGPELKQKK